MTTKIGDAILRASLPHIGVLPQDVLDSARFALPFLIFPGAADCGHKLQPRNLARILLYLAVIPELPRAAGPSQQEELVLAREPAFLPIPVQRTDVTHKRRNARHRADQEMIGSAAFGAERKSPLGSLAHEQLVASLELIELRCEIAASYELEE